MGVAVRNIRRAERAVVEGLGALGVSTVHEAQGRTGLLAPDVRPIQAGVRVAGTAVTVSLPPGDNLMVHVAVELCQDGDVLVVAPTSRSDAGYMGELIATSLSVRGVRAAVIDAGVRDVAEIQRMGFPVWSHCVSAYGTVKESLGDVNMPVVCAGQAVAPGDVVVADDDGIVVVPRAEAQHVLDAGRQREAKEAASRVRYQAGELSLDLLSLRALVESRGLEYVEGESSE